ncbi:S41 family peptidase [Echinicola shivajiensis]|uniref:S41 family peptidase n=1 Tax=Echinicola shivajiensis TaxID=1035916 RepID=UPI001BFC712B|nr:S41 family peptidase [Echinicola shivajiensis]
MNSKSFLMTALLILCFIADASTQTKQSLSETEKIKQFGLVWGLIKYHHPQVSKGNYDWDNVFIENFSKLDNIKIQAELNQLLLDFVNSVDPGKIKVSTNLYDFFTKNYDYKWIEKYKFSPDLYSHLSNLRDNTNIKSHYITRHTFSSIPSFDNENGFDSFNYTLKSHRLLSLFSFWNVIQYYYVNKYLIDKNWLDILDEFIVKFSDCKSKFDYEKTKANLFTHLNDSHSFYYSQELSDSLMTYKPPFGVNMINDTLVISFVTKTLEEKYDLKLGDLIFEVDGKSIHANLNEKVKPFLSSSNDTYLKKWANWIIFSNKVNLELSIKRDNQILKASLNLDNLSRTNEYSALKSSTPTEKWKILKGNIGYLNLKTISNDDLKNAFKCFSSTKGIIIDLRNYPRNIYLNTLAKHLYPKKKKFIQTISPIPNRPSLAHYDKAPLKIIKNPFIAGSKNPKYYKGKVLLLVNKTTMSQAEYIGMAIQVSPNCITVGENTAGAQMNVASFILPDKSEINFTSLGAFYPDGTEAQRIGLKIDYYVKETTSNFLRDQYLLKGIELINSPH